MKEAPNPGPSTSTGPGACLSEGDLIKERWKVHKSIGKVCRCAQWCGLDPSLIWDPAPLSGSLR